MVIQLTWCCSRSIDLVSIIEYVYITDPERPTNTKVKKNMLIGTYLSGPLASHSNLILIISQVFGVLLNTMIK